MNELSKFINDNDNNGCHYYPWLISMYNKIMDIKPVKIREIGTGTGSTTFTMAKALYDLNNGGSIITMDGQSKSNFQNSLNLFEKKFPHLYNIIEFNYGTDFNWEYFTDGYKINWDFDLLYIDIDNTGERLENILKVLNLNNIYNKHIIFEGGSIERDCVTSMHHMNGDGHPHWDMGMCDCEFTDTTLHRSITRLKPILGYEVLDETFSSVSYFFASENIVKQFK